MSYSLNDVLFLHMYFFIWSLDDVLLFFLHMFCMTCGILDWPSSTAVIIWLPCLCLMLRPVLFFFNKNLKPSNFPSQLCVHDMETLSVLFGHYPPVTMRWFNANRRIPVATGVAFRWHCNQRIQPQHVGFFQGPWESIPGSCQIPKTCGHLDNVQVLSSLRQLDPLKFLQLVISRGIITFGHLQLACQGVWGVSSFWTTPSLWTNGDFDPCGGIHINQ